MLKQEKKMEQITDEKKERNKLDEKWHNFFTRKV